MRNKLLAFVVTGLLLSGCGTGYNQDAFIDKAQEKVSINQQFGSAMYRADKKIMVIASKQYILDLLKKMAVKHNHLYEVIWDRQSASVEYTADYQYKLLIHPGNSSEVNESKLSTLETYSLIEFKTPKTISPQFKKQLLDAFKEEQKQHDPHEHVNGVYTTNLKSEDVKNKLDQFFRRLYPSASFSTVVVYGKTYNLVTVPRGENSGVKSSDNIFYLVKDLERNQTQIQLHSGHVSYNGRHSVFGIIPKKQSQKLLEKIVQKLGL